MKRIEVGEYIRNNKIIAKVIGTDDDNNSLLDIQQILTKPEEKTVKHSKQLIDLIEVGDYVNGELITDKWDTRISSIRSNFSEEDIKTILTKEIYMANCYKVGGEEC